MKIFVDHAGEILLKSWALWLGSFLPLLWLAGVELAFYIFTFEVSPALSWGIAFALATMAAPARVVKQRWSWEDRQ